MTFSLRTRAPALVTLRHATALVQLEQHFQAIRTGPKPLTKRDRVAISGLLYRAFAENLEADPGNSEIWQKVQEANDYALNGQPLTIDAFPGEGRIRLLEKRFGSFVDVILAREGIVTDDRSRMLLLADAGRALTDAAKKLERNADGDYTPDPVAARFPSWDPKPTASGVSINEVFDRWKKERKPSASTISTWRGCVDGFVAHLGHNDMARVTRADVVAWKDALMERGHAMHSRVLSLLDMGKRSNRE